MQQETDNGMKAGLIFTLLFSLSAGTSSFAAAASATDEGFETGDFLKYPWVRTGDALWTVQSGNGYSGTHSAGSGAISQGQFTTLKLTLNITAAGSISFYRKNTASSYSNYLTFYVDGVSQDYWNGTYSWSQESYYVLPGVHTFEWEYSVYGPSYSGNAWIDDIKFPPHTVLLPPSSLFGTPLSTGSVKWIWSGVTGATGYRVISNSDVNVSGNLPAGTTSWIEAGLQSETIYSRRVVAFNTVESATSTAASASATKLLEDFETGGFSRFPWVNGGAALWIARSGAGYTGNYSAESGAVAQGQTTSLEVTLNVTAAGNISFYRMTTSQSYSNYLTFYIDDISQDNWNSSSSWYQQSYLVPTGVHTFKWTYSVYGPSYSGNAWIDDVRFPPHTRLLPPSLLSGVGLSPGSIQWTWPGVIGATGYRVMSTADANISGDLPADTTYWIDTGLQAETSYVRRVAAFNAEEAATSVGATATTLGLPSDEDFETGNFSKYAWARSGNTLWTVQSGDVYDGTYSARSGIIGDSQSTTLQVSLTIAAADEISFYRKISSEGNYDFLKFYIDGIQQESWSGEVPWNKVSYAVTTGVHVFKWVYIKDISMSKGLDAAWVDDIKFPRRPPDTPSLFSGIAQSSTAIRWNWNASVRAEGYKIFGTNDLLLISTTATSWIESPLSPNAAYQRRLQAYNNLGVTASVSTGAYTLANAPSGTQILSVSSGSVLLAWAASGNPPLTLYRIGRSDDSVAFDLSYTTQSNSSTVLILASEATNYFKVRAENGNSIPTSFDVTVSTFVPDYTPPTGAPSTPADTGVFTNSPTVTFNWAQGTVSEPESWIAGYFLEVGTSPEGNDKVSSYVGNITSYTLTFCLDGLTYYARVRAVNGRGIPGQWSQSSDGITVDLTPPSQPSIMSLTHPDPDIGYCNAAPVFQLSGPADISGIAWYFWGIDQLANTVPTALDKHSAGQTIQSESLLADGTWYFHVTAKDAAGNMGTAAAHYKFIVKREVNPAVSYVYPFADGATLAIAAGTINNTTNLQVRIPVSTEIPPGIYDPVFKVTPVVKEIKFEDGTTQLNKNLILTLKYIDSDIRNLDANSLRIAFYDETVKDWRMLGESVPYPSEKKVLADVNHLSLFAIMGAPSRNEDAVFGLTNYPNPFTAGMGGTTKIRYRLKSNSDVAIKIYDLIGDLAWKKTILAGEVPGGVAGINEIPWDGKNDRGDYVATGGYICVVKAGGAKARVKIGVK